VSVRNYGGMPSPTLSQRVRSRARPYALPAKMITLRGAWNVCVCRRTLLADGAVTPYCANQKMHVATVMFTQTRYLRAKKDGNKVRIIYIA